MHFDTYYGGRGRASNNRLNLNLDLNPEALTEARIAALVRQIVELLDEVQILEQRITQLERTP
ncbi:MAG: hypothetical protein WAU39_00725 [Polyangiales bacterium]